MESTSVAFHLRIGERRLFFGGTTSAARFALILDRSQGFSRYDD
jgi:hypothetical protein